mmetsp:Transcript_20477/g.59341  ORF Transcript_20477/g.59341 Transcript_20477/m.59341 type:complete len:245 (+) Transcript_20477:344-1078(+)
MFEPPPITERRRPRRHRRSGRRQGCAPRASRPSTTRRSGEFPETPSKARNRSRRARAAAGPNPGRGTGASSPRPRPRRYSPRRRPGDGDATRPRLRRRWERRRCLDRGSRPERAPTRTPSRTGTAPSPRHRPRPRDRIGRCRPKLRVRTIRTTCRPGRRSPFPSPGRARRTRAAAPRRIRSRRGGGAILRSSSLLPLPRLRRRGQSLRDHPTPTRPRSAGSTPRRAGGRAAARRRRRLRPPLRR